MFHHRPLEEKDIPIICELPQNADELFYMFPRATWPLTPPQLADALETRQDSTIIEMDGEVVASPTSRNATFAAAARWATSLSRPRPAPKG